MNLILDATSGSRKKSFAEGVVALIDDAELALFEENANKHLCHIGKRISVKRDSAESVSIMLSDASDVDEHGHEHTHSGMHSHEHEHHSVDEVHLLIDSMGLDESVRRDVLGVYAILVSAEAKAHDVDVCDVHFHEVGNLEAISFLTISCMAMNTLSYVEVSSTPICTGFGYVDCAHGRLPIPAPATANVLEGLPTFVGDIEGELTTPTGAALLRYFARSFNVNEDALHDVVSGGGSDNLIAYIGGR